MRARRLREAFVVTVGAAVVGGCGASEGDLSPVGGIDAGVDDADASADASSPDAGEAGDAADAGRLLPGEIPPGCPLAPPANGAACTVPGLVCTVFLRDPDGEEDLGFAACEGGAWTVQNYGNPPAVVCPATEPSAGASCADAGNGTCHYAHGECCPALYVSWECAAGVWSRGLEVCRACDGGG